MPVRLGLAGYGVAAHALLPFLHRRDVAVTAVADPSSTAREAASSALPGAVVVPTVEELCARPDVDAVYVATPTPLHAAHSLLAVANGKAVVVEKPMATTLDDARAMVDAADTAGVKLIVGHSQSFEAPVRELRKQIASGAYGRLRAVNAWYYTDWIYRPRHPDELDTSLGGGVTLRQAAHHVDIVRTLGGGLLRSVRGMTGVWDDDRRTDGSYSAYLEFEDATPAMIFYSGYDHFPSSELTFGLGEAGQPLGPGYATARRALAAGGDEISARAGGSRQADLLRGGTGQPFFGLLIASCERADLRISPEGLLIYDDEARREVRLTDARRGRDVLLDELVTGVRDHGAVPHDGRWGLANLEVCLAIRDSARARREILLEHQVEVGSG